MKFDSDIDIDFGDRDLLLSKIEVTPASIRKGTDIRKHNTGAYPTAIPYDPVHGTASLDYKEAEQRGYIKIDFLNVFVYQQVKSEQHLTELMTREPAWHRLLDKSFCEKLIHIGNYHHVIQQLVEPINSIPRMAMFLALIRPGKKHLLDKTWKEISETIWDKDAEGYTFKKAHSIAYSHLVVVNMNLLCEQEAH